MTRWALILFCAAVTGWQFLTVALPVCPDCLSVTADIAAGRAESPFAERLLTPSLLVALGNTVQVHVAFHFVMFALFFRLLWAWADRFNGSGLASVALAAVALTLMLPTWYFSSYTVTEWVLWLSGLLWLTARSSPSALQTGK